MHSVVITEKNKDLAKLELNWGRPLFTSDDGLGSLDSLYQAGDAIVSVACLVNGETKSIGSGVIVGPGMIFTATHVLDDFKFKGLDPILLSFLPENKSRIWLPKSTVNCKGESRFQSWDLKSQIVSDLSIMSCDLHSDAITEYPLSLIPMELCLPLPNTRLWAVGFRHGELDPDGSNIAPIVTSGLVTECFPNGRGERMPSPCVEVDMETLGGMSGGPVFNEDGRLVGIVSSSFDGGPSYVTLIWDAMRLPLRKLPSEIWKGEFSGILEGIDLDLVRVKGKYDADSQRNVTLTLSDEEMKFCAECV